MTALFKMDGGSVLYICGIYLFLIFLLILGLSILAKYLAERNAKKWERRLAEEDKAKDTNDT